MKNTPQDIKDIETRINKVKEKNNSSIDEKSFFSSSNSGLKIVIEFISSVFIGGAIGFFLDKTMNTQPILLIFMLLCGLCAGYLGIIRTTKQKAEEI